MNYLNNKQLISNINHINPSENSTFFICPYKINDNICNPFLTFLLYKQTIHKQDLCSFLYIHFNKTKQKTLNEINSILSKFNETQIFKGAIQLKEHFYLFYEFESTTDKIPKYNSHSLLFWSTIYEIIHLQYIFNIPIHYSTFSFFYTFPKCIHLKYFKNNIPYPQIIYSLKNINQIFSYYDVDNQCYIIKHESNIIDINNVLRCILFTNEDFSGNNIMFKHINHLQIISE
jgi:hypothetical protein